jgi:hypothetical protein
MKARAIAVSLAFIGLMTITAQTPTPRNLEELQKQRQELREKNQRLKNLLLRAT